MICLCMFIVSKVYIECYSDYSSKGSHLVEALCDGVVLLCVMLSL